MTHGYASFCTENMAKTMLFLPVEIAPGHLIDARDLHDAVQRMKAATANFKKTSFQLPQQLRLF